MLLQLLEDLLQVDLLLLHRVAGHQDVIQVDKVAVQPLQHFVQETLEGLPCIPEPKGILRNLYSPKGVMTAVLGTS